MAAKEHGKSPLNELKTAEKVLAFISTSRAWQTGCRVRARTCGCVGFIASKLAFISASSQPARVRARTLCKCGVVA